MVVHNNEDNIWASCRCSQYVLSLCHNPVIANVETLNSHIFLVSGVGTNPEYLACPPLKPMVPISHGRLNKLGDCVLRDIWCNFLGVVIGLGLYGFSTARRLNHIQSRKDGGLGNIRDVLDDFRLQRRTRSLLN